MEVTSDAAGPASASASSEGPSSRLCRAWLRGHTDTVLCLDGGGQNSCRLASGSADGSCRVWDMRLPRRRSVRAALVGGDVTSVTFHPVEDHVLLAAAGRDVLGFDLRSDRVILPEPNHRAAAIAREEINQIVVEGSGLVAIAEDSGKVQLLNLHTWARERTLAGKFGHENICSSVASRPGNIWGLASGGLDAAVVLWKQSGKARVVRMMPDADDGSATSTGGPQLLNPPFVHSVSYSLDGQLLAAGLGDGTVVVLDAESGQQQTRLRGGHGAAVAQVLHAPCGLFSAGNDSQLCLWRESSAELRWPHSEKVNWLAWSDGALSVAGLGKDISVYSGFM
mmetsp:Transcript_124161/g.247390  ORF Transcript_124161/g.247390 Transcript_124161/m.247390 type:complete len:338 (-) Transcript_124161:159-1172(-)